MSVSSRRRLLTKQSHGLATSCCRCLVKRYTSSMNASKKCPYDVLEVSQNATRSQIKDAFVTKTKKFHPDRNIGNPDLHERFVELNEAYSLLKDAQKRSQYDQQKVNFARNYQTTVDASNESPFGTERYRPGYWNSHDSFFADSQYTSSVFREYQFETAKYKDDQRSMNKYIIGLVICFMFVGAGASFLHINYIRKRFEKHGEKVNKESISAYEKVREKARVNGPEKQLKLLASSKNTNLPTDVT